MGGGGNKPFNLRDGFNEAVPGGVSNTFTSTPPKHTHTNTLYTAPSIT